ncbi:MAG: phosphoglucosamine mutase [Thermoguttaceae bacterium]
MSHPLIISVSGLRGVIGETLTPLVAIRYAAAFHSTLPQGIGSIVVTRDSRPSGHFLAAAITSSLNALGRDTIDAGIAPTPTTGVLVRQHRAAGGIQISASHNPSEYNGIKLFSCDGRVIPAAPGAEVLARYNLLAQDDTGFNWVTHNRIGTPSVETSPLTEHVALILKTVDVDAIRSRRFRVLLDANNGAGGAAGRLLLEQLGCEVTILGETPNGAFAHTPEPTAENLTDVASRVAASECDVAFCQDPDADRLALIDETGHYIGEEYTVPLCAQHVLSRRGVGTVVINCATSRMTEDVAKRCGATLVRTAVGEANVVDAIISHGAVFGGEGNGGPIDPQIGLVRDSFVGMAIVLDALALTGQTLSQLASTLPRYAMRKEKIVLDADRITATLDAVEEKLGRGHRTSRLDGLRIDFDENRSWVLLRASNTEPIVRVIAEAMTPSAAESLCREVREIAGR